MRVLLDTNILLRIMSSQDAKRPAIEAFLKRLRDDGARFCIAAQNVTEFWVALTRPTAANGMGVTPSAAKTSVTSLLTAFDLVLDPPDTLERWLVLCTAHGVRGRQAYDARLVAIMQGLGITHMATLNGVDFKRFPGLTLLTPDAG